MIQTGEAGEEVGVKGCNDNTEQHQTHQPEGEQMTVSIKCYEGVVTLQSTSTESILAKYPLPIYLIFF